MNLTHDLGDSEVWYTQNNLSKIKTGWLTATGRLIYDPRRLNFKKTHKSRTLILDLQLGDLDLYYQKHLAMKYGSWYKLQRPMFGLHVTVVRGDEYKKVNKTLWGTLGAGQKTVIEYNPTLLKKKWQFWSLPVRSPWLEDLRSDLGLDPWHDFHITIAREYEWQKGYVSFK